MRDMYHVFVPAFVPDRFSVAYRMIRLLDDSSKDWVSEFRS